MFSFIYNASLHLYKNVLQFTAHFNNQAHAWVQGRQAIKHALHENKLEQYKGAIWVHAASLGEFEQARPIIERIKDDYPTQKIIVSFFSPSGYEVRKNYALADYVCYLPFDTDTNQITQCIEQLSPSIVLWVRYEFWQNTLRLLYENKVPTVLIAASFRDSQLFFKWYGKSYLQILHYFSTIFCTRQQDVTRLHQHGIMHAIHANDTRIDRVCDIASKQVPDASILDFIGNRKCMLVAGSTWVADIDILSIWMNKHPEWVYIIAPHHIDETTLCTIEKKLTIPNIRYTALKNKGTTFENVLLVDTIGMLAAIYRLGQYAYVGGGFGTSVHNVLEAAVYNVPIMFGPHYHKQAECSELLSCNSAHIVYTSEEIDTYIKHLENNPESYQKIQQNTKEYVDDHKGGTEQILKHIKSYLDICKKV